MSGQAHANLEDLKRLQSAVGTCVTDIEQALKTLQRTLDRADWQDSARNQFESKLKDATSQASRTASNLKDLEPILSKKIADLKQYLH